MTLFVPSKFAPVPEKNCTELMSMTTINHNHTSYSIHHCVHPVPFQTVVTEVPAYPANPLRVSRTFSSLVIRLGDPS